MIAQLISFPISVILFIWMLRIKKDDPFPKGSVVKMLITGALCTIAATIVTVFLGLLVILLRIGPVSIADIFSNPQGEEAAGIITRIQSLSGTPTLLRAFVGSFLTAALVEEVLKYCAMRLCLCKTGTVKTRMDVVVCAAIVGLAFQVIEDFTYAGDIGTALLRAVTPFHFVFGAIMGYYYGKFLTTGRKSDRLRALFLPILIHGLYDFSIQCLKVNDYYIVFTLIMLVLMLALTVYMIVRIHKWSREGTLAEPIENL